MELKVLSCPGRTGGNAAPEMELLIPSDDVFFQTIWGTLAAISSCVKRALLYSDQPHKRRLLTSVEAPPLTVCGQTKPERTVCTQKAHQWGDLLIFVSPRVFCLCSLSRLFHFCSLAPFHLQTVGSIEALPHTFVSGFMLLNVYILKHAANTISLV